MTFRTVGFSSLAPFNSAVSSEFLDMYNAYQETQILDKRNKPSHQTFAASSFRCDRRSWFRLRGVQPDVPKKADVHLEFSAEIGTACHRIIQRNLKAALGDAWVSVEDYLSTHPIPYEYELTPSEDSLEVNVSISNPPIRFACDGIVIWKGKYYLLEIKTSEFSSWSDLTGPKSEHIDQVKCYTAMLGLSGVLMMYQDRQYGDIKCYELTVSDSDKSEVIERMNRVLKAVEYNIAPEPLSPGDKWCQPSYCPYYKKCKDW